VKYLFEEVSLTCVEFEKRLGLKRGDIKEVTIYPEGAVEIETAIDLDATNQQKVKDVLKLHNLPRGKKPDDLLHTLQVEEGN